MSFRLNGRTQTWHPGKEDTGNLLGTSRTLDKCKGAGQLAEGDPMESGILSRDGWAIVDESQRHVLQKNDSDWGEWVASRPEGERLDWYIFAYGHDYTAALADFTKVAGKIPLLLTVFRKRSTSRSCVIEIGQRVGKYSGMQPTRSYVVVMGGLSHKPVSVAVDSEEIEPDYDPETREAVFILLAMSSDATSRVTVRY